MNKKRKRHLAERLLNREGSLQPEDTPDPETIRVLPNGHLPPSAWEQSFAAGVPKIIPDTRIPN